MKLQKLLSFTRKAVDEYQLIDAGDRIAVGLSGGKDSLTLLYALHGLKRFYPKPFDIVAITCSLGYKEFDTEPMRALCAELDVPYHVVETDIAHILFEERKEKNPCSLCAKMRKGAMNEEIQRLGCNKIAYGHHKDDIIETMLLSLIYEGRFHTFSPKSYLDRMDLTLIRPLLFVDESDIIKFSSNMSLPVSSSRCPIDGLTKRQYAKELLASIEEENPGARARIFTAILNSPIKGWDARTRFSKN